MEDNKLSGLSPHERFIYENKDDYVKINEGDCNNELIDVTDELMKLTENFKLGEMIKTDDFSLEDTMNSVELDHYKMDTHSNYYEVNTYRKLIREGKVKCMEDLNYEEVKLKNYT